MIFTEQEQRYLQDQLLGRVATQKPDGTLQVSPVGFSLDPTTGTIDVTGRQLDESRKYRNVAANGRVALVVDDLLSTQPWHPRCVEIRGRAEATTNAKGEPVIRISPERIISFGLDPDETDVYRMTTNARNVSIA